MALLLPIDGPTDSRTVPSVVDGFGSAMDGFGGNYFDVFRRSAQGISDLVKDTVNSAEIFRDIYDDTADTVRNFGQNRREQKVVREGDTTDGSSMNKNLLLLLILLLVLLVIMRNK